LDSIIEKILTVIGVKVFSTSNQRKEAGETLTRQYEIWQNENPNSQVKDIHTATSEVVSLLTIKYLIP